MNRGSAGLPLEYGVASRVGCALIETYPDGVVVHALVRRTRHWSRLGLGAGVAAILVAMAVPSGDQWNWAGLAFRRAGTPARVAAAVMGAVVAVAVTAGLLRPRPAATLTARGGRFTYTDAGGDFECPLGDIERVEHVPSDGDGGGTLLVVSRESGRRWLFAELDANEVDAIAEVLLPIWKAAKARGAA